MEKDYRLKSDLVSSATKDKDAKDNFNNRQGIKPVTMSEVENRPKLRKNETKADQYDAGTSSRVDGATTNSKPAQRTSSTSSKKSNRDQISRRSGIITIGMAEAEARKERNQNIYRTDSVKSFVNKKHSHIKVMDQIVQSKRKSKTPKPSCESEITTDSVYNNRLKLTPMPSGTANSLLSVIDDVASADKVMITESKKLSKGSGVDYLNAASNITEQRLIHLDELNKQHRTSIRSDVHRKNSKYNLIHQKKVRRRDLPAKPKDPTLTLWVLYRSCIGKDLSTIAMPVGFSEPISMIQRLAEDFEFSYLLDKASVCTDPLEQLAIVSAFVVSAYASPGQRITKPFITLLGETYELDRRDDMGWRLISEQVSSQPPTSAQFCESRKWKCWKTHSLEVSVFRGNYLKETPSGETLLDFGFGNKYTWGRVETKINNVLNGKMRLDYVGNTDVVSHKYGNTCRLTFLSYDNFDKNTHKRIEGYITDYQDSVRWTIEGKWDSYVDIAPAIKIEEHVQTIGHKTRVWHANSIQYETRKYYNFSLFAIQLNEPEEYVAPTDSRKRKDMRWMEKGEWEKAEILKKSYDDRELHRQDSTCMPIWFTFSQDHTTGTYFYRSNHLYWKAKQTGDWSKCPDIFSLK